MRNLFWSPPVEQRTRCHSIETFRVYDGSEGTTVVDDGLMVQVLRHPQFGERVEWTPPAKRPWTWGEGTTAPQQRSVVDIRQARR